MRGFFFVLSVVAMIAYYCFGVYALATDVSMRPGISFLVFSLIFGLQARRIGWSDDYDQG